MTRVLVLSGHDLTAWQGRFARGEAPNRLPYGIEALENEGFELDTHQPHVPGFARKVRDVVEHRSGMVVARPLLSTRQVARADLVVALLEREGMLGALLKSWSVPPWSRRRLVLVSVWLADDLRRADGPGRARLLRRTRAFDLVTHFSHGEDEIFEEAGFAPERHHALTFGVAHRFYEPTTRARDIDLLAVGQDRGRDYRTLVDAVRGTDLVLDLVCRPDNLVGIDLPSNVRVHGTVTLPAYRDLLARARVVAVPTREMAYPTGSSVALEAASSGCAVVVTGTRAMRDYVEDGITGVLVGEGDVHGWRENLVRLVRDDTEVERLGRAARAAVVRRFTAEHMWHELAEVLRDRGLVGPR